MTKTRAMTVMLSTIFTLVLLIPLGVKLAAQQSADLPAVGKAVICEKVENRTPWGVKYVYPSTIGKLCCFTQLTEIPSEGTICHIWYHGGQEMAKVELPISPPQWRTYSSKIILPSWKGSWRVEIIYGDYVLKTLAFAIQ